MKLFLNKKQILINFLRLTRLLFFFEFLRSLYFYICFQKNKLNFNKKYPSSFTLPPFLISYDAYSELNPSKYYVYGKYHAKIVSKFINKYASNNIKNIYEWGCGPMRVLRHLPENFKNKNIEFYGSDYNSKTIKWAKENFCDIKLSLNKLSPPLPFESMQFDVIYSISVFTHLSQKLSYEFADDIYRLLKKNGIFISTFHGDFCKKHLTSAEQKKFLNDEYIERGRVKEGSRLFSSYHPKSFIMDCFSKFEILEHKKCNKDQFFPQDWYVFKKI